MKCRNRLKCSLCGRFHPTILHDPTKSSVNMSNHKGEASDSSLAVPKIKQSAAYCSTENSSISACCDTGAGDQTCAMAVIPVRIKLKDKSHSVVTYAFFDSGSSVSFCTENLMRQLGASGKRCNITLNTMGEAYQLSSHSVKGL